MWGQFCEDYAPDRTRNKEVNSIKSYKEYIKYLKEKSYGCDSIFLAGCIKTGVFIYGVDRNKIIDDMKK